jgi:hypothetical protein
MGHPVPVHAIHNPVRLLLPSLAQNNTSSDTKLLDKGELLGVRRVVVRLHAKLSVRVVGSERAAEHLDGACLEDPEIARRVRSEPAKSDATAGDWSRPLAKTMDHLPAHRAVCDPVGGMARATGQHEKKGSEGLRKVPLCRPWIALGELASPPTPARGTAGMRRGAEVAVQQGGGWPFDDPSCKRTTDTLAPGSRRA